MIWIINQIIHQIKIKNILKNLYSIMMIIIYKLLFFEIEKVLLKTWLKNNFVNSDYIK